MAEIDPYATLGVPRTATRDEIARAYRRLAKRYHPDAGATPSATMGRINEAWHILSDPGRRGRWDRDHVPVLPPHWAAATGAVARQRATPIPRPPAPPTPTTLRDSPWLAIGAVVGALGLSGVVVLIVGLVAGPLAGFTPMTSYTVPGVLRLEVPAGWRFEEGDPGQDPAHRIVAHLVSFPVTDDELCTSFGDVCEFGGNGVPIGEASVIVTVWQGGPPPVATPVRELPGGPDADRIIGGQPAVYDRLRVGGALVDWWQLSPPGFPDRWIEVQATIGRAGVDPEEITAEVDAMVESIEFEDG